MHSYIIAIDQSTSATKAFLLDEAAQTARKAALPHAQSYPQPGYVEQDAGEIWRNVKRCVAELLEGIDPKAVKAIGIANQRETLALWDRETGEPVCPAIGWQDGRGRDVCKALHAQADAIHRSTGLSLSPYYTAAKAAHALQNDSELRRMAQDGALCLGTMDSYLLYRMTNGRAFATDVTNASRTQLMDLRALSWSEELLGWFGVPRTALAKEILPSDACFGETAGEGLPAGIPILSMMGDSHAALFAQGCHSPGQVKATYGTGSSVMMNVGPSPIVPDNGLSASVGFCFDGKLHYVLEGNVTCSGDTLVWLRDGMGLFPSIDDIEPLARQVESSQGVHLVPAFSGLGAPYFDEDARAILCGMSRGTTKAHIARAALESIALQDADVLEAMRDVSGMDVSLLRADGGPTRNALLMQMQADLAGCPVRVGVHEDLSAMGAGLMAGASAGVYPDPPALAESFASSDEYQPTMSKSARQTALDAWRTAIRKTRIDPGSP